MRSTSRLVAGGALLAGIVLAGCGSSGGSSGASSKGGGDASSNKKIDVCSIITPADAEKVVGGPVAVQAPASNEGPSSGVCIYKATGEGIRVSLLQVRVYPGPQYYGEAALSNTKSIDIEGTQKAFIRQASGGKNTDVQFVKDDQTGAINFTDTGATAPADIATNVEAIATKLADAI